MDHMMPVMDGVETTICIRGMDEDCRTDCKNVPIVALTANTIASRELFHKNGFNDFMYKPIDMTYLHSVLEKWIPNEKQVRVTESTVAKSSITFDFEIPGVDIKKGIELTGDDLDGYMQVLEAYHESGLTLLNELPTCLESDNTKLYITHIHALKSASASIGADGLSRTAEALELAGDKGDFAFVRENNPNFLKKLSKLLDSIGSVIEKKEA